MNQELIPGLNQKNNKKRRDVMIGGDFDTL